MSETRPVYDSIAPHYDCAIKPLERICLAGWRAEALKYLPKNSRLLEIGAGTGLNFPYYPDGSQGAATELSGAMIEKAREKASRPSGIHLVRNRAEELPFPDHSFDAACATLVFCSVVSPRKAFSELKRVVRPRGVIALLEHVRPPGLLMGPLFDALNLLSVPLFEDHFNRQTACAARETGLQVERIERRFLGIFEIIICRA